MPDDTRVPQGELESTAIPGGIPLAGPPPTTDEDLARIGVESQLIPSIISITSRAERLSSNSTHITLAEAERLIEALDKVHFSVNSPARALNLGGQVVSSTTVNISSRSRCFRTLRKFSSAHGVLPKSYFLTGVKLSGTMPRFSGGFTDVWMGQQDGEQVCVKAFRTHTATNQERIKRVRGGSSCDRLQGVNST